MNKTTILSIGFLVCVVLLFFRLIFLSKLPIPTDALVGLYHPFRDLYAKEFPRGIPFKNPLITDPVLQQIPWRNLALSEIRNGQLPLWNPYAFSGYPLLANIQSAPFYPLNILFLVFPFVSAWTILVLLQLLLGALFMYLYLKKKTLPTSASLFGAIAFSFSGFFISWGEWGTIAQTGMWLPLIFLSIEFLITSQKKIRWSIILIASLLCAFLAGHLQTFVYVFLMSILYSIYRLYQEKYQSLWYLTGSFLTFILLSSLLWIPQLQFILLSGRDTDLSWQKEGFFIPLQHLIQFLIPDFFGNPATGNYYGVWNYGEFLGYAGISTIVFAAIAVWKRKRDTLFFFLCFCIALVFAVASPLSYLPYQLHIPFVSSTQPTRLLFVVDFCLAILAAMGFEYLLLAKKQLKSLLLPVLLILGGAIILWLAHKYIGISNTNWAVSRRNMIIPLFFTLSMGVLLLIYSFNLPKKIKEKFPYVFILLLVADLLFVFNKYNSFSSAAYFYPNTKTITYLTSHAGIDRIMSVDRRVFPANISVWYRLQSVSGYDPLYLSRYAEYISAMQRGKPDISGPFGFQRIITPDNYTSRLSDLLGVKYVLSLTDISSPKLKKVFSEGETQIYENTAAFPRAFFVTSLRKSSSKEETIQKLFASDSDLRSTAVIEGSIGKTTQKLSLGSVTFSSYTPNQITLQTSNSGDGFLVLTDIYYPTWKAVIDGENTPIYLTDYLFRGVIVPKGRHTLQFNNTLF